MKPSGYISRTPRTSAFYRPFGAVLCQAESTAPSSHNPPGHSRERIRFTEVIPVMLRGYTQRTHTHTRDTYTQTRTPDTERHGDTSRHVQTHTDTRRPAQTKGHSVSIRHAHSHAHTQMHPFSPPALIPSVSGSAPCHRDASPASGHVDNTTAMANPALKCAEVWILEAAHARVAPDQTGGNGCPETTPTVMKKKSQRDLGGLAENLSVTGKNRNASLLQVRGPRQGGGGWGVGAAQPSLFSWFLRCLSAQPCSAPTF